ncbi:MAG: hypothetical protein ACR2GY_06635 [Phycisphaerales bacterium]
MKATVFLASLGLAGSAVIVGQLAANPGAAGLRTLGSEVAQTSSTALTAAGGGERTFDISPCQIADLRQFGKIGTFPTGTLGLAIQTTGFNAGDVQLPWWRSPDVDHPVIGMNMYRVNPEGRLEQIGMSWFKHAWAAVQGSTCGNCQSSGSGRLLGVGCADIYGSSLNADQYWLGPRWELKPHEHRWMDGITFTGSHFARNGQGGDSGSHNNVEHRLRVRMSDLDVAGSTYYCEGLYYILRDYEKPEYDDLFERPENMLNNATHRRVGVTRSGDAFTFPTQTNTTNGPVMMSWGDVQGMAAPNDEGVVYVSSRAVDIGGGNYRYEYCVYNMSLDREILNVEIPVGGATVSNFGFHCPKDGYYNGNEFINESPYDIGNWTSLVTDGVLSFEAPTPEGDLLPNSIRLGTMYTFWFEANAAPDTSHKQLAVIPRLNGSNPFIAADIVAPDAFDIATSDEVLTTFGTTLGGNLASLESSDDNYYRVQSAYGFLSSEPNLAEVTLRATSPTADPSAIRLTIEGRNNNPNGTAKVRLLNYDTNRKVQVDTYIMGTSDSVHVTVLEAADLEKYVGSKNQMELVLRTSIVATFSITGFVQRLDCLNIAVQ